MIRSVIRCLNEWPSHLVHSRCSSNARRYIPRRAVLYVPASDDRKLHKAATLGADCVVLDCEDGVAANRKQEARDNIHRVLSTPTECARYVDSDLCVRVNAVQSDDQLCAADLQAVLSAERLPDTLMVPKVESCDQLDWLYDRVRHCLSERPADATIRLIVFAESAAALLQLGSICAHACRLSAAQHRLLVDGVVLGSDDFCADIGAERSKQGDEILFARQLLVAVAKSQRLQAIDAVYIDYGDLDGLCVQAEQGARFGFTGKQVIHPGQVAVVQRAFSPSPERLEWARQLEQSFRDHQETGRGAFTFRGQMVDMPLVVQARNVLRLQEASGDKS